MSDYTKVATKPFTASLVREGSWGVQDLGTHECVMDLYFRKDNTGFIEWDIPTGDTCEEIGLVFEIGVDGTRTLCDYDGVFSLPPQAVALLREAGVIVPEEFE